MTRRDPLVSHLEHRIGLSFSGAQEGRMLELVGRFRDRAGLRSNDAYRRLLERDPAGLDDLVAALTVGETHFFREPHGIAALQHRVLPGLAHGRDPDDDIEVWSAGCATGEEAYTIAMAATEVGLGRRVRVLGTDLSAHAIAKAGAASYGEWSLRGVDADRRRAWFRQDGGHHHVHRVARRGVRFRAMNLLDGAPGRFDVVVCRNVLMYFTPEALQRAAEMLRDALRPGGWLLTGASDPPLDLEGLERCGGSAPVYRRPDDLPLADVAADSSPPARRRAVATLAAPTISPTEPDAATTVRALGGAGRADDALTTVLQAIAEDPLNPELRYLTAVLHLEAGRQMDATAAARAALFLDPRLEGASLVLHHAGATERVTDGV